MARRDVTYGDDGARVYTSSEVCGMLGISTKTLRRAKDHLTIASRPYNGDRRVFIFTWAEVARIAASLGRDLPNVDTDLNLRSLDERVRRLEGAHSNLVAQIEHVYGILGVPVWPTIRNRVTVISPQFPPVDEVEEMLREAVRFVHSLSAPASPIDGQIVLTLRNASEALSYLPLAGTEWYAELGRVAKHGWTIVHLIQRPKTRDQAGKLVEIMIQMLRMAPSAYKPMFVPADLESMVLARELALLPGVGIVEMRSTKKLRIPDQARLISLDSQEYASLRSMLYMGVEKASDALKPYDWPGVAFCEAIADIEGLAGNRGLVMDGLSSLTIPHEIHDARLANWKGSPENLAKAQTIVASYKRRRENFIRSLAQWTCRDICSAQVIQHYVRNTGLHANDDILAALGARALEPAEREQHIKHIIGMLSQKSYRGHYQLGLIPDDTIVNPRLYRTFLMVKSDLEISQASSALSQDTPKTFGRRVLLEAYETQESGAPREVDLEIDDPWIVYAFQELFERLWQQTEHKPSAVIRWLRNLI